MVHINTANRLLSTPPNCCLRATNVQTFFLATARTELLDDANRSIGQTYCVQASSPETTPWSSMHRTHDSLDLIVINFICSSLNNVDLLLSMSSDCCMPWCRGWCTRGTMAAVGRRRPPWWAGEYILPSFR